MIPRAYITEWRGKAPWRTNEQVEQDLILSRCLIEIYSVPDLARSLAFRGGTALHKLFLPSPMRYSEDIDLVQTQPGPIGPVFDTLRKSLAFLGKPKVTQKDRNNVLTFSVLSTIEPVTPLKLKIEINCREHVEVFGTVEKRYSAVSTWFSGECQIRTYTIEELLGSKMRALYQRKKGRDVFDLWYCLSHISVNVPKVLTAFQAFMRASGSTVSAREFQLSMEARMDDMGFRNDTTALLRPETKFDFDAAWQVV